MKRFLLLLLITIPFQEIKSQNLTIRAFTDSIFNNNKYWKDEKMIPLLRDSALRLYNKNQLDSNSLVLVRYYLFATNLYGNVTDSTLLSLRSIVATHQKNYLKSNSFNYSQLASCYIYLGMISHSKNKFSLAKDFYEAGLIACNSGLAKEMETPNKSHYESLLTKDGVLLNNLGYLIYQSTNHKDPIDKRNEAGPIIEKYWVAADSIEAIIASLSPEGTKLWYCSNNSVVVNNLLILYGYYYPNELKFNFYYKKLLEQSGFCENGKGMDLANISLGWITFCKEDFEGCVPFFLRYLRKFPQEKSSYVQDARYALVESYYHLGKPDSVIYYGNAYLKDTTKSKDFLFLSMSSMYMTEMYLQIGNTNKAKEHLKLSKDFMAKSQHEAFIREYKKEGEQIMMQAAIGQISKLSEDIEGRDQKVQYIKLVVLIGILIISLFAGFYFVKRLREATVSKGRTQKG